MVREKEEAKNLRMPILKDFLMVRMFPRDLDIFS